MISQLHFFILRSTKGNTMKGKRNNKWIPEEDTLLLNLMSMHQDNTVSPSKPKNMIGNPWKDFFNPS